MKKVERSRPDLSSPLDDLEEGGERDGEETMACNRVLRREGEAGAIGERETALAAVSA